MKQGLILIIFTSTVFFAQKKASYSYKNIHFGKVAINTKENLSKGKITDGLIADPNYFVWGTSVIEWNGKYHAYYSRWPKKDLFRGWMTNCEIAHAVAETPRGPFSFKNVVIQAKKELGWDLNNAHNPYAIIAEGKIQLFYIANNITPFLEKKNGKYNYPSEDWLIENRTKIRESQCIGLATADTPAGPFKRIEKTVVAPDNKLFKKIAVNPAAIYKDGLYHMIVKGDAMNYKTPFRIQLIGTSKKAKGPYNFYKKPVYEKAQTEDACYWFDSNTNKHYMVCHVMGKSELALFSSINGKDWKPAEQKIFMPKEFQISDGSTWKPNRVERPFLLTDKTGKPIRLYLAVYNGTTSGNISIPIKF